MRVFTDTIGLFDMRNAMLDAQIEATSVWIDHDTHTLVHHEGKRGRRRMTHNVQLEGCGARHTRHRNSGGYGASQGDFAATWMDWGWFIAVMFRYEPTAVIGQYDGREDFHEQTRKMLPSRLGAWGHGDASVANFARNYASWWPTPLVDEIGWRRWPIGERVECLDGYDMPSPFTLVDRVCPPNHLITLHPVENAMAWLNSDRPLITNKEPA